MYKNHHSFASAFCSLFLAPSPRTPIDLKTSIGLFEARTSVIIVKGYGPSAPFPPGRADILVRSRKPRTSSSGQKVYGLAVEISGNGFPAGLSYVDEDEIDRAAVPPSTTSSRSTTKSRMARSRR